MGDTPTIVAVTGDSILGVTAIGGNMMWSQPWATQNFGNIATPIAVGGYLFVSSNYGKGCVLFHISDSMRSFSNAREVYFRKNRVMSNHHSTCVYKNGFLYGYDGSELACVDLKKGGVIDCGLAVNPNLIRQQMDSGIVFGLSAALYGRITITNGQVQQSNYHDVQALRIDECPVIETDIIASTAHPEGVGEPATPPIAPAVANALFVLTGQRLRELPLALA